MTGRQRYIPAGLLLLAGCLLCSGGLWIHGKALLAQVLLRHAWNESRIRGEAVRPWPWADTWPKARLRVPRLDRDLIVLAGQAGATLAFGPGMHEQGAEPGQPGTCILAGHRDTSFRFLRKVRVGDELLLEDTAGGVWRYRITLVTVRRAAGLYFPQTPVPGLALVTCYPFDGVRPATAYRYVVLAELVERMRVGGRDGIRI